MGRVPTPNFVWTIYYFINKKKKKGKKREKRRLYFTNFYFSGWSTKPNLTKIMTH